MPTATELGELQKLLLAAETVPESGPKVGDTLETGDVNIPYVGLTELKGAGHVVIYDTRTGEPSVITANMLARKLELKENGRRIFTTIKPQVAPIRGQLKCPLHADNPRREEFTRLGFPVCRKANLRSPLDVESHLRSTHKRAWRTLERMKEDAEKQENRDFQRSMMQTMAKMATPQASPVEPVRAMAAHGATCPKCGLFIQAKNQTGVALKMKAHLRKEHGG